MVRHILVRFANAQDEKALELRKLPVPALLKLGDAVVAFYFYPGLVAVLFAHKPAERIF